MSRGLCLTSLDQVCGIRTSLGISAIFLKLSHVASRIRTGQESNGFWVPFLRHRSIHTSSLRTQGPIRRGCRDERQSKLPPSANHKALWLWAPAFAGATATFETYCVFATRGGVATVWNCVASSTAGPNGVGMTVRNGTRMRVPAIGTKEISIRRSPARYWMIGRSGM